MTFRKGAVDVDRIALTEACRSELEARCLIIYTGQSRISDKTIKAVLGAYRAGDATVRSSLARMRELAREMARALTRCDVDALADAVNRNIELLFRRHPLLSRAEIIGCLRYIITSIANHRAPGNPRAYFAWAHRSGVIDANDLLAVRQQRGNRLP